VSGAVVTNGHAVALLLALVPELAPAQQTSLLQVLCDLAEAGPANSQALSEVGALITTHAVSM
jgi:hypothetical protein